ncbi:MAG: NADH-quinone oxidoreductase subunit N [Cytophagaceae bacterium]|nr:NADH-quinone oxidoreductase subunit N [Cytophagaceae bacterium]
MNIHQQLTQLLSHFAVLGPEVFVAAAFLAVVTVDLVWGKTATNQTRMALNSLTLVFLVAAGVLIWRQFQESAGGYLFGRMLLLDEQAIFFKALVTLAAVVMVLHIRLTGYRLAGEVYSLLLALLLGLYLLTMAVNLLSIYLAIELISITSYVLTGFMGDRRGAEGAVKYALFGAISAAVMLYGMSLLYGLTGTLNITDPAFSRHLAQADGFAVGVSLVLTLAGLFFKISAVPFHLWNPDVYEAAPTPVVSFFSVAPKAAAFLVLMRFEVALPFEWAVLLAGVALLTLTVGNFSALWQGEAKRMLAYSSIAQSGFVLVGLAAATDFGLRSATFYLATYLFATMGAFLLLDLLVAPAKQRTESLPSAGGSSLRFERFYGLGLRRPALGVGVVLVMMALVGFPLTAGFSAKLLIFSALWETYQNSGNTLLGVLLVFGLLNTAVSLVYYLRLPFVLFFRTPTEPQPPPPRLTPGQGLLLMALLVPIVLLFLKADWLMNFLETF